ncbi:MAG: hypothetical protein ACKVN9_08085 [Methylophilaceae bacterium]
MSKLLRDAVAGIEKNRANYQLVGLGLLVGRLSQTGRFLNQHLINLLKI